jgi:hypothetical protein
VVVAECHTHPFLSMFLQTSSVLYKFSLETKGIHFYSCTSILLHLFTRHTYFISCVLWCLRFASIRHFCCLCFVIIWMHRNWNCGRELIYLRAILTQFSHLYNSFGNSSLLIFRPKLCKLFLFIVFNPSFWMWATQDERYDYGFTTKNEVCRMFHSCSERNGTWHRDFAAMGDGRWAMGDPFV